MDGTTGFSKRKFMNMSATLAISGTPTGDVNIIPVMAIASSSSGDCSKTKMPVARKSRTSAVSTASPAARSSPRSEAAKKGVPRRSVSKAKQEKVSEPDEASDEDDEPPEPPSESDYDDASEDAYEAPPGLEDEDEPEEADESEVDSDFLDDDEDVTASGKKRKSVLQQKAAGVKKKVKQEDDEEDDDAASSDPELLEGQTIAMRIHSAPKTGHVPPGQISQNTLNFLRNLQDPRKNDREWFKSHEPSYRLAEKEWVVFVEALITRFREIDNEIPALPPKDLIHRIYRDVRFSNDKTPYKRHLSTSISRGGRKGIWAGYFVSIQPNNKSIIAAGVWGPQKNELATFRHNIKQSPDNFRAVISEPAFVKLFGPPKPHPKGKRQNVFGNDDMLKLAPKGVAKDHKDIDLLRLRSIAVVHTFDDETVVQPDFMDKIIEVAQVQMPLVHLLNEYISLPDTGNDE